MKKVLLVYEVDCSGHVDVWSKSRASGLFVSLFSMCEVMRLYMYNAHVGLDLDFFIKVL